MKFFFEPSDARKTEYLVTSVLPGTKISKAQKTALPISY